LALKLLLNESAILTSVALLLRDIAGIGSAPQYRPPSPLNDAEPFILEALGAVVE
jgi:hypothetical protein